MEENKVKPEEWKNMNFDQLIEQKNVMFNRYEFLIAKGYKEPAKQLLLGIEAIDRAIAAS